jgi:hypothetical protein
MDKITKKEKIPKKEKKAKLFSVKNFIEKEAEESDDDKEKFNNKKFQKLNSNNNIKDTQYSTDVNNEEDSYGISSDKETEKIEEQIITNRELLNKEKIKKEKNTNKNKNKRKRITLNEKKDNKKRTLKQIEKTAKKIDQALGIVDGKLNICFEENREKKNLNDINANNGKDKTPEKKFKDEIDDELLLLKMSVEKKNIFNINKKNNKDFIKRIKENENFIKNNNIIINDSSSKRSKSVIIQRKKEINDIIHPKLKLYNMKGAFLKNKNKKK